MARIRSVHPGLFTDEGFMSLSPEAALFMIGLWCECDDEGVFEWKPLTLKARIRPAALVDASVILAEIEAAGFITKYEVFGKPYGLVRNFTKYQRPKFPKAIHPKPVNSGSATEALPREAVKPPPKPPQMEDGGWRMEGGGEKPQASPSGESASPSAPPVAPVAGKPPQKAKGTRLESDWELPQAWRDATTRDLASTGASAGTVAAWITTTAEGFKDHWLQSSRPTAVKRDWQAAWRVWVRKEIADGRGPRPSPGDPPAVVSSQPPEKRLRDATIDEQELARRVRKVCGKLTTDAEVAEWRKLDLPRIPEVDPIPEFMRRSVA